MAKTYYNRLLKRLKGTLANKEAKEKLKEINVKL
jgi:hypothetical protein